ncbi:RNA polymerase factor sigma-54 [Benzoatithermus flavus]|uniref:RNA polymerase sigma-54 factor n=1 Tax=Benzoatithermus flavus TaxID=3108223 RepID=A0ABU8XLH3_9PROT
MSLAPGIRLDLRQTQSLVLTPQLQQAIRLLQMSNIELASAVDREVADNPFLQRADRDAGVLAAAGTAEPAPTAAPLPAAAPRPADFSLSVKRAGSPSFDDERTPFEARLTRAKGLREHLAEQVMALLREPRLRDAVLQIVESVEDDGYLREDDATLAARFHLEPAVVSEIRAALQRCEPTGVGARDLAECLALQLKEKNRFDPAMATLIANLPLLAKADFNELMRRCGVDAEDLQDMIAEIKRLDPKPGLTFAPDEPPTVVPDLFVLPTGDGRWRVELNAGTLPRVLVDVDYHAELTRQCALDRRTREYLSERIQSANWLAKALDQRARTMLRVGKAIFARQIPFLEGGAQHLRPLVLRDIAAATGLHESTVSRATSDKYVATPHGTFPLKYFFTTAIPATSGDQAHSAEAIRQMIKRMIDRESPTEVLSDDQIVAALKAKGVMIARRTVAKYRESLGIASSVERRRAKALGR